MGAKRREHHRREEGKRQAGIDATAARIAQEQEQARYQVMIDALKPKALAEVTPPRTIQSTADDTRGGVRTARSTRGTVKGLSRGLASLRIPLNIGGGAGGGLNIG